MTEANIGSISMLKTALACRETKDLVRQCKFNIVMGDSPLIHPFKGVKGEPNINHKKKIGMYRLTAMLLA